MSFSITNAKSELSGILHGTDLSQIENIDGVFNRAARQLLLDLDPAETKRKVQFDSPIYYGVYDYTLPEDLKGNKVIDIIPPQDKNSRDTFQQNYNQDFDVKKQYISDRFTIFQDSSKKYIRLNYSNTQQNILLNSCNGVTANGTWTGSFYTQNLRTNNLVTYNGGSTVCFDSVSSGASVAMVTNQTQQQVDLSNHYNNGVFFLNIYIPQTIVTGISVKIGSSTTDYYYSSVITTDINGNAFKKGWNTISVAWSSMTKYGSPDNTKIDTIILSILSSASLYGICLGEITNNLGYIFDLEYYSKYLFRNNSTGTWQETVMSDDDLINLDTDSYNLFLYQSALIAVQQALGQDAGYDTELFSSKYQSGVNRYKRMYKSEITKPQITYYQKPAQGYNNLLGRNTYSL